jgi:hypothetical protein
MQTIRVSYSGRTYEISINEKKRTDTVVIHSDKDTLAARITPNGGNYDTSVGLSPDGTIRDNNGTYGWIAREYFSDLPIVLDMAKGKAREDKTTDMLAKAKVLTQKCLDNMVV